MPKHLADRQIGIRAIEELYRVFPNLLDRTIAKRLGLDRKILSAWKNGGTPSGFALQRMCWEGCDVIYILTGRRPKENDRR